MFSSAQNILAANMLLTRQIARKHSQLEKFCSLLEERNLQDLNEMIRQGFSLYKVVDKRNPLVSFARKGDIKAINFMIRNFKIEPEVIGWILGMGGQKEIFYSSKIKVNFLEPKVIDSGVMGLAMGGFHEEIHDLLEQDSSKKLFLKALSGYGYSNYYTKALELLKKNQYSADIFNALSFSGYVMSVNKLVDYLAKNSGSKLDNAFRSACKGYKLACKRAKMKSILFLLAATKNHKLQKLIISHIFLVNNTADNNLLVIQAEKINAIMNEWDQKFPSNPYLVEFCCLLFSLTIDNYFSLYNSKTVMQLDTIFSTAENLEDLISKLDEFVFSNTINTEMYLYTQLSLIHYALLRIVITYKQTKVDKTIEFEALKCPLTRKGMKDPVLFTVDKHSYEKSALLSWLQANKKSPITSQVISDNIQIEDLLIPNRALKSPPLPLCPLTGQALTEPVLCSLDGETYDKSAIVTWLNENRYSPLNQQPLEGNKSAGSVLYTNLAMLDLIKKLNEQIKPGMDLS